MILHLPNFDGTGLMEFEVRRPSLMKMAYENKLPNRLLETAKRQLEGKQVEEADIKYAFEIHELFCYACMVNPTYEEVKEQMTDEQMTAIYIYAVSPQIALDRFHKESELYKDYLAIENDGSETE